MASEKIGTPLVGLPFTAVLIGALVSSSGGVVEAFGGNYHIECKSVDEDVILTSTPGSPPIEAGCVDTEKPSRIRGLYPVVHRRANFCFSLPPLGNSCCVPNA